MNDQEATALAERQEDKHCTTPKAASTDERLLVAQAKSGNSSAFGELYECHRPSIYSAAFRILRNRQDAEDAVQRSFQRAFTNLGRFREDSSFATWVTRIAINEALMLIRRRRANTPFQESNNDNEVHSTFEPADKRPTPEQALAERERRATVLRAITHLRESLRIVVLLHELQGLTNVETARRLGLTVSAVKARTFHARRCLRRHFEQKYKAARVAF
ncbi:MAG: sigma-70 family RNA polymerase sigma factor [Candidatus Acidiferrum sp.]